MKIKINDNETLAREVRKKVENNDGYCPCALEKNPDTKCMCKDFRDKVKFGYIGECHCGLYISIE